MHIENGKNEIRQKTEEEVRRDEWIYKEVEHAEKKCPNCYPVAQTNHPPGLLLSKTATPTLGLCPEGV